MGLVVGCLTYILLPFFTAFLAWLPPGLFLLWDAANWQLTNSTYDSTWDTFFGKGCGGSECLYALLLTAPFLHIRGPFRRSAHPAITSKASTVIMSEIAILLDSHERLVWYDAGHGTELVLRGLPRTRFD